MFGHASLTGIYGNKVSNKLGLSCGKLNSAWAANWHEHAAFQRSAVGRSTAGNDVVATILISLFLFFLPVSSVATFSHRKSAGIKNLFCKRCLERPKT